MFGDLLEAWDEMSEAQQRLAYRLGVGITKKAKEKPDPSDRRSTMIKSLGMRMSGAGKKPPPSPIPKGTKVHGVELGDSKNESIFAEALQFWEGGGSRARKAERQTAAADQKFPTLRSAKVKKMAQRSSLRRSRKYADPMQQRVQDKKDMPDRPAARTASTSKGIGRMIAMYDKKIGK